jgi:hypothetical protein
MLEKALPCRAAIPDARTKTDDSEPGLFGHGGAKGQGCAKVFFTGIALIRAVYRVLQCSSCDGPPI